MNGSRQTPRTRKFLALALEPRMMFDAAGAATAQTVTATATEQAPDMTAATAATTTALDDGHASTATDTFSSDTDSPAQRSTEQTPHQAPDVGALTGSLTYAELFTPTASDGWSSLLDGIADVAAVGDQVYVVGTSTSMDWTTYKEVTVSTLFVFQRAADGTLTLSQSIGNISQDALTGAAEIKVSDDGATLVVIGTDKAALFSRDTGSGAATFLGSVGTDIAGSVGAMTDAQVRGNTVYVTAGDSLLVFTRDNGTLTLAHTYSDAGATGTQLDGAGTMAFSSDGRFLVVGTSGGTTLASVFRVESDGSLTFVNAAQGSAPGADQVYYTKALTLSPDGRSLYVIDNDGSTHRLYTLSMATDGSLSTVSSLALDHQAVDVLVSPDGAAVFVVGTSQVDTYSRATDGKLTLSARTTDFGGNNLQTVTSASLSADGSQVYLAGKFSWKDGLMVLDLTATSNTYTEGGQAVVILPGGTLTDPQLDALNSGLGDYKGASITIERSTGANAFDRYSFLDGDGLALENGQISLNGTVIATFSQTAGMLTVTFTASVTRADAQNVLRKIVYANSSKDPTQSGAEATLRITLSDGGGHDDSLLATVGLIGVNDAPIVTTTALTPTYAAEGERVALFSGTTIDTVEANQKIWQVTLTLEPADSGDVLGVSGGRISLARATSGTQTTATGLSYAVAIANGKAVVTLYLMQSGAEAAAIIDGLTFGNTGNALSGTRTVTLAVKEYADANATTIASQQAVVTLTAAAATNTAPNVQGASAVSYTERGPAIPIAPEATVSDNQMDAFNGGKGNYDGATLTVRLAAGASSKDLLAFVTGNGLTLEGGNLKKDGVTIGTLTSAGGVLTVTFSDAGGTIPTTADVQNVLRQITYSSTDNAPAPAVAASVTLTDQRGLESSAMAVSIAITAVNDLPSVILPPVATSGNIDLTSLRSIPGLGTPSAAVTSADGRLVYVTDGTGAIAVLSRDIDSGTLIHISTLAAQNSANGIGGMALSPDGTSLYAIQADGGGLLCYTLDGNGSPTYQGTLVGDYSANEGTLYRIRDLTVSEDGNSVYVINDDGIAIFSRDSNTGTLTYASRIAGSAWSSPYLWQPVEIVSRGNLVYVVTDPSFDSVLIIYKRTADGSLDLLTHTQSGGAALKDLRDITVSTDGATIYVAGAETISRFNLDASSGELTYRGNVTTTQGISDIALSKDGATLYVTLGDGSLGRYAVSGGTLQLIDNHPLSGASAVSVTSGGAVVIGGDVSSIVERHDTPAYVIGRDGVAFAAKYALADAEMDASGNYGHAVIRVTDSTGSGSFGIAASSGLSVSGNSVSLNGKSVATMESAAGTLTVTLADGVDANTAALILHSLTYANDLVASGTVATLTVSLHDGTDVSTGMPIQVTVAEINSAPILTANGGSHTIDTAKGGQATLFTGTSIDTIESGQTIRALTLTVSGLHDGSAETLTIDGTSIPLVAGTRVTAANGITVTVTIENSAATVTMSKGIGMGVAQAETLVNSITFGAVGSATLTEGQRVVTLTAIQDSGGTAQGGHDTSNPEISATVAVVSINDAPSLAATGRNASYTAGDIPQRLFSDAQVGTGETDQTIVALTLTVTGVSGGHGDALVVDGTTVSLNSSSTTTAHGLTVTVSVSGGTANVTIASTGGLSTAAAAALIDGIAYASVDGGTLPVGQRVITLTTIKDNGGTANGGTDTTQLAITAVIDVPDAAPMADAAPYGLKVTSGTPLSVQLPQSLFRHPNGDVLAWTVADLPEGISFDPDTRTLSGKAGAVGNVTLVITVTDESGQSASRTVTLSVSSPNSTVTPPPIMESPSPMVPPTFGEQTAAPPTAAPLVLPSAPAPFGTDISGMAFSTATSPTPFLLPIGDQLAQMAHAAGTPVVETASTVTLRGDNWVAELDGRNTGSPNINVQLPPETIGAATQVRLESGMPLPSWIRFDARTGQISVDARQINRLGQLRLQVQTRDGTGETQSRILEIRPPQADVPVENTGNAEPADSQQDALLPAQTGSIGLSPALPLAAPGDLLAEARALLARLTGQPAGANGAIAAQSRHA